MITDMGAIKDRRKHERFPLALQAMIELVNSGVKRVFDLLSRDVSAGGAFFHAREFTLEGTEVRLDLAVPNERLKELTGAQTLIRVQGKVVRSDRTGVEISFDRKYQILGMKSR